MVTEAITVNGMNLSEYLSPQVETKKKQQVKLFQPPSLPNVLDSIVNTNLDWLELEYSVQERFRHLEERWNSRWNQGNVGYVLEAQVDAGIRQFASENPRTFRRPITEVTDTRNFRFTPDGHSNVIITRANRGFWGKNRFQNYCEIDALVMIDGTPVIIESKAVMGKDTGDLYNALSRERTQKIAEPVMERFHTDTIGYAVVVSTDGMRDLSNDTTIGKFRERGGMLSEFITPQKDIVEGTKSINRVFPHVGTVFSRRVK